MNQSIHSLSWGVSIRGNNLPTKCMRTHTMQLYKAAGVNNMVNSTHPHTTITNTTIMLLWYGTLARAVYLKPPNLSHAPKRVPIINWHIIVDDPLQVYIHIDIYYIYISFQRFLYRPASSIHTYVPGRCYFSQTCATIYSVPSIYSRINILHTLDPPLSVWLLVSVCLSVLSFKNKQTPFRHIHSMRTPPRLRTAGLLMHAPTTTTTPTSLHPLLSMFWEPFTNYNIATSHLYLRVSQRLVCGTVHI